MSDVKLYDGHYTCIYIMTSFTKLAEIKVGTHDAPLLITVNDSYGNFGIIKLYS